MKELVDYIDTQEARMLSLLERLVNTDSGTYDKAGVDRVGDILAESLATLGFGVERSEQKDFGNHLIGRKPGQGSSRLLFIGHMDTVFSPGTAKQRPFRVADGRALGPGVVDMKGGIVCLLSALEAMRAKTPESYDRTAMDVVFNSDEEVLSPTSRPIIEALARQAHTVCVFEPARPGGEYVIQRKGVGKYILRVSGRAAHAGAQPKEGRSAIEALAHKIIALHALTDDTTGTTVNVGVVRGGERPNIIADHAYAEIDLRVVDHQHAARVHERITEIARHQSVPDTRCELTGGLQFPPMLETPASRQLFETICEAGRDLGLNLQAVATGGGSDGNHAAQFAPTLDGMGPKGGGAHSDREYMEVATLLERAKVTAFFLIRWPEVVKTLKDARE